MSYLFFSARKKNTALSPKGSGALGVFCPELDEAPGVTSATGSGFRAETGGFLRLTTSDS